MLELWSPEHGFGRCPTDGEGRFSFLVPADARRFELMVFARGLLKPRAHPALPRRRPPRTRRWLRVRTGDGYRFDIRLQGDAATGFFDL